jgi:hypothetical protein
MGKQIISTFEPSCIALRNPPFVSLVVRMSGVWYSNDPDNDPDMQCFKLEKGHYNSVALGVRRVQASDSEVFGR